MFRRSSLMWHLVCLRQKQNVTRESPAGRQFLPNSGAEPMRGRQCGVMWRCACSDSAPQSASVSRGGERQERRIRQGIQQGQATVSPTRMREDPKLLMIRDVVGLRVPNLEGLMYTIMCRVPVAIGSFVC
jgi:hypothetical protein